MYPIALVGAFIVTISLLSYGIGSISLQRFKIIIPSVLIFLTLGVILDVISMVLLILQVVY